MSLKNTLHQKWMKIISQYSSAPHESKLLEEGILTPEEFVVAGDCLIANCPVWAWSSAPEGRSVAYLPADKQYLINRRVICQSRAQDFGKVMEDETDIGEGWIQSGESAAVQSVDLEADDECVDLDELDLDSVEPETKEKPTISYRTYDITICYDNYYHVAHIYLYGIDNNGIPLTLEQMYSDISASHAEKTVTYEDHPFISMKFLSIHPCQHSNVILRLIERLDNPDKFCAPMYFFLFLKFIHTVIPTIDISTPAIEIGE